MSDVRASGAETLAGGASRPPRRWSWLLFVAVALAIAVVAFLVHRERSSDAAQRLDDPTLRVLSRLAVHGGIFDVPAQKLNITVALDDDAAPFPPIRVKRLQLEAGALGPVRAIVIDHYEGAGPGPRLDHVSPFTAETTGIEMHLTFARPAQCHRPVRGDPPLIIDIQLPSGRMTRLALRINGVTDPFADQSAAGMHIPWPLALSRLACEQRPV